MLVWVVHSKMFIVGNGLSTYAGIDLCGSWICRLQWSEYEYNELRAWAQTVCDKMSWDDDLPPKNHHLLSSLLSRITCKWSSNWTIQIRFHFTRILFSIYECDFDSAIVLDQRTSATANQFWKITVRCHSSWWFPNIIVQISVNWRIKWAFAYTYSHIKTRQSFVFPY